MSSNKKINKRIDHQLTLLALFLSIGFEIWALIDGPAPRFSFLGVALLLAGSIFFSIRTARFGIASST